MAEDIENLKKQKDKYVTRIFWLCLQIAAIFAVPAVLGALVGKKIEKVYNTGAPVTVFILIGTFLFSWIVTIVMYKKVSKNLSDINQKIAEKKQEDNLVN